MKEYGHGGNIYEASRKTGIPVCELKDLSSNVSPFIPEGLLESINLRQTVSVLPEPYSASLAKDIATYHEIPCETVTVGSGSSEFIQKICEIYAGKKAIILQPTYIDYASYAKLNDIIVTSVTMPEKTGFSYDDSNLLSLLSGADLCFICNPNNPTGTIISKDDIRFLADTFKKTLFVVDESYIDFCIEKDLTLIGCSLENIAVLRSFSKSYGLPGLRAGYMYTGSKSLTSDMTDMMSPWNVSTMAQVICRRALKEIISPEMKKIQDIKHSTISRLSKIKQIKIFHSHTNYMLIKLKKSDAPSFCSFMLSKGYLVRDCSNFEGLGKNFIRIAMKEADVMNGFCELAAEYFGGLT